MKCQIIAAVSCGLLSTVFAQVKAAELHKRIGYEILEFKSRDEIVAWASQDITREQFDALKLPLGWLKNQPREGEANRTKFLNSPGQDIGAYSRQKQFGFDWLHVATVTQLGMKLDKKGLLRGSMVKKNHRVAFDAHTTLALLVSPEERTYVRISRDANPSREKPTLPKTWKMVDFKIDEPLEILLPKQTLVIRTDNHDSFQGPIDLGAQRTDLLATKPTTGLNSQVEATESGPSANDQHPFEKGANCLFIGHSFFIPVARSFDAIARQNDFPNHRAELVFAGGTKGAPGSLWKNPKKRNLIEGKLASGKVELMGMPANPLRSGNIQDYKNWIDAALKRNPNTRFLIGSHWVPGGPRISTSRYAKYITTNTEQQFQVVVKLRKLYPGTAIYFISYGKTASLMKLRYEAGELNDINALAGRGQKALFRDQFMGHAGPMMLDLCSLVWLNLLYGANQETLAPRNYNASDVKAITDEVIEFNQKFLLPMPSLAH